MSPPRRGDDGDEGDGTTTATVPPAGRRADDLHRQLAARGDAAVQGRSRLDSRDAGDAELDVLRDERVVPVGPGAGLPSVEALSVPRDRPARGEHRRVGPGRVQHLRGDVDQAWPSGAAGVASAVDLE